MNKTTIEYLTHTWNPIAMQCTPVSKGCDHCWHLAMAKRMAANPTIPRDRRDAYSGGKPVLVKKELDAPLGLKKPAIIGVQFMGDLFHESVPETFICDVWTAMGEFYDFDDEIQPVENRLGHKYLVLTKRPERALDFLSRRYPHGFVRRNVLIGVTVEHQKYFDRVKTLLKIPAAGIFVSLEPLLGNIDLAGPGLDWVIVGGESGPGAQPMHPDWVRSIRDQCQEAGVPFFFKQWGEWIPIDQRESFTGTDPGALFFKQFGRYYKVGKKKAGRMLDGRIWDEFPSLLKGVKNGNSGQH